MKKSVQKVGMEQLRSCHGQGTSAEELQDSQISEVVIKKAQAGDLPRILEIYAYAREFMKRTGNPNQWKENAPQKEVLEADIRAGQLYVVRQKNRMTGVFALVIGKDPTYAQIEQGAWEHCIGLQATERCMVCFGESSFFQKKKLDICGLIHTRTITLCSI